MGSGEKVALEFKYDRANPGGTNKPKPQCAGAALADIFRLAKIPPSFASVKYFVYVTDREMAEYFKNPRNRLRGFFEVAKATKFDLCASTFLGLSETLVTRIGALACDCRIGGVLSVELPNAHCLRVLEVGVAADADRIAAKNS